MLNQLGKLNEVFNLPQIENSTVTELTGELVTIPEKPLEVQSEVEPVIEKKIEDSDYIRTTLKDIIESTQLALELALINQQNDTDPKASDAVAKLAATLAQTLKTLIDLSKVESDKELEMKKMKDKETKGPEKVVTNNNLIVTDTASLIEMILNKKKEIGQ